MGACIVPPDCVLSSSKFGSACNVVASSGVCWLDCGRLRKWRPLVSNVVQPRTRLRLYHQRFYVRWQCPSCCSAGVRETARFDSKAFMIYLKRQLPGTPCKRGQSIHRMRLWGVRRNIAADRVNASNRKGIVSRLPPRSDDCVVS